MTRTGTSHSPPPPTRTGLPAPIVGVVLALCGLAILQVLIVLPALRAKPGDNGELQLVGLVFHPVCLVLLCWWTVQLIRRTGRVRRRLTRFLPVLAVVGTVIVTTSHAGAYYATLAGASVVLVLVVLALLWLPRTARRFLDGGAGRH